MTPTQASVATGAYKAVIAVLLLIIVLLGVGQFVQYTVCNGDVNCVSGYYSSLPATTSQSTAAFKLAEGCGDYVAIYVASSTGIMYPNISVKQNAAPFITGYCAQAGGG